MDGSSERDQALQHSGLRVDELTQLPTFITFKEDVEAFIAEHGSSDAKLALIATNLINFRAYNRLYGFERGDMFLCDIAVAFKEAFEGFPVMRYSEDHFYALCEDVDIQNRIKQINDVVVDASSDSGIRFKSGIYYLDSPLENLNNALDKAQAACESIRDNYEAFCCVYDESLMLTQHVVYHLDEAIEKGWIEVWAQPIIRVETGRPCGLEALTRWNDPKFGLISPCVFIPALEQRGLVSIVDLHVVRSLGELYQRTIRSGQMPLPMSVNFSRMDFEAFDVVEELNAVCSEYDIPHSMIHVEVTESALAHSADLIHRQLATIHEAGYEVWIDDFGSGYSTFSALLDFEFDVIKLDMDFLRRYSTDSRAGAVITSLIDMAKQLGVQTLAEGVETEEQYAFLKKIGCEMAQGFLFWKPLSPSELAEERRKATFDSESRSEAEYFDEVGRVNIVGHGLASIDAAIEPAAMNSAMAIIELRDGSFSFLASNAAYDKYIKEIGFSSLEAAASNLGNPLYTSGVVLRSAIIKAFETGEPVVANHVDNALRCVSTVRFISKDPVSGATAFLITSVNLTRFNRCDMGDLYDSALPYLLDMHDRVDICSADGSFVRTIYHKRSGRDQDLVSDSLEETVRTYCENRVYESDRQAFRALYDLGTIDERLAASPRNVVGDCILTRDSEAGWVRKLYTITSMNVGGERMYLSCLHSISPSWFSNDGFSDEVITRGDLWSSFVNAQGIAAFWKDARRRYLGANRAFLDHFELDSTRSFVGRTGEEMGWLVDPAQCQASDETILEKGTGSQGDFEYTIVSGEVHRVMISKLPIKDSDGEVVGILGLFIDLSNEKLKSMIGSEKMRDVLRLYQNAYDEQGRDFSICALRLRYSDRLRSLHGDEFETRMLDEMAQAIMQQLSHEGICCMGADNLFIILHQTEDVDAERCSICEAIRSIKEVDGIPCEIPFDRAFANYAEFGNFEAACEALERDLGSPSCGEALRSILSVSSDD